MTFLSFADGRKASDYCQLGAPVGLLINDVINDSIYHPITWIPHKSKEAVKSVPAPEILASSEAMDEMKAFNHAFKQLLNVDILSQLCANSKDLFTYLSTRNNSIDRSIRNVVSCILHGFHMSCVDNIIWIPGNINLADMLTKPDISLTGVLQLTLFTDRL